MKFARVVEEERKTRSLLAREHLYIMDLFFYF